MEKKTVVILGATGSIGSQTLDVLKRLEGYELVGFSFHRNVRKAQAILKEFKVKAILVTGDVTFDVEGKAVYRSLEDFFEKLSPDITLIAVPGFAGLEMTLKAIEASKRIALANKESLVCGGFLIKKALEHRGTELIPVDSEHSAIFQILDKGVMKIVLTASGGALRDWKLEDIEKARVEDVLKHPVWSMGRKITVDSATMVNKAFEILEAMELFELDFSNIDVKIHREGLVHGMVFFKDGTVKMLLSNPDMRIPIAYSLTYPDRVADFPAPNITNLNLLFEDPDPARYPSFFLVKKICRSYAKRTAYNAADEEAVEAFLNGKIKFIHISRVLEEVVEGVKGEPRDLKDLKEIHEESKKIARKVIDCLSSTSF